MLKSTLQFPKIYAGKGKTTRECFLCSRPSWGDLQATLSWHVGGLIRGMPSKHGYRGGSGRRRISYIPADINSSLTDWTELRLTLSQLFNLSSILVNQDPNCSVKSVNIELNSENKIACIARSQDRDWKLTENQRGTATQPIMVHHDQQHHREPDHPPHWQHLKA